jgi:hypothetical protein
MVEITLIEVDLADAQFNAPFARSSEGEPIRGLKSAVGKVARSTGGGTDGDAFDRDTDDVEADSPGRGVAMVGAFLVLVTLGWLVRRSRRRGSVDERAVEAT